MQLLYCRQNIRVGLAWSVIDTNDFGFLGVAYWTDSPMRSWKDIVSMVSRVLPLLSEPPQTQSTLLLSATAVWEGRGGSRRMMIDSHCWFVSLVSSINESPMIRSSVVSPPLTLMYLSSTTTALTSRIGAGRGGPMEEGFARMLLLVSVRVRVHKCYLHLSLQHDLVVVLSFHSELRPVYRLLLKYSILECVRPPS